jgi:prevent-host-death family protein
MEATVHEAKTHLSKLIAKARAGEDVVVTSGKERTPVARIIAAGSLDELAPKVRPLGIFAAEMGPDSGYDWSEPMPEEELGLWESPIVSSWEDKSGAPKDIE